MHDSQATAGYARVIGSTNPCGLLAALIRRQLWHYVTESDEDTASTRLKEHLYGQSRQSKPLPSCTTLELPVLSKDAFVVHELQRELARRGWQGDLFAWVYRTDPTWSRERWDRATAELAQAQASWQYANACNRLDDLTSIGNSLAVRAVERAQGHSME